MREICRRDASNPGLPSYRHLLHAPLVERNRLDPGDMRADTPVQAAASNAQENPKRVRRPTGALLSEKSGAQCTFVASIGS